MSMKKIVTIAAAASLFGTVAFADAIKPISKSTQAIPPVPPAITAIFGPNVALVAGTVGVGGVVVGTVVIAGVVFSVIIDSSSTTTSST